MADLIGPHDRQPSRRLGRRLLPLQLATVAEGFVLWYGVEKLFMTEVGFDAASIGLLSAVFAALVPVLDVPLGILADRWSRKGVLMIAFAALAGSSLAGALSSSVAGYLACCLLFSGYVAAASGATSSMVYDTVLEETGSGAEFPLRIGRLSLVSSLSLLAGSLSGAVLAQVASPRATYVATVPVVLLGILAVARFDEPRLHRASARLTPRQQLSTVLGVVRTRAGLAPLAAFLVLAGTTMAVVWEFNQLWLVEDDAPTWSFGVLMAGLFLARGVGGAVAGHLRGPRSRRLALGGMALGVGSLVVARDAGTQTAQGHLSL